MRNSSVPQFFYLYHTTAEYNLPTMLLMQCRCLSLIFATCTALDCPACPPDHNSNCPQEQSRERTFFSVLQFPPRVLGRRMVASGVATHMQRLSSSTAIHIHSRANCNATQSDLLSSSVAIPYAIYPPNMSYIRLLRSNLYRSYRNRKTKVQAFFSHPSHRCYVASLCNEELLAVHLKRIVAT